MARGRTWGMAKRIVGLSIDGGQIRAVEVLLRSRGESSLTRAAAVPVPVGSVADGRVIDEAALVAALKSLWNDAGFSSRKVYLAIDARHSVLRRTELPDRDEETIRGSAKYDIGDLLTYSVDDAVFDVAVLDHFKRNEGLWVNALVVAVEESLLAGHAAMLDAAGLELVSSRFFGDALTASLVRPDDASTATPSAAVVIEDSVTSIFVQDGGGTLFARGISVGVGATTLSMAEELESELALLAGGDATGTPTSAPGVTTVVDGIRRTLDYFSSEIDDRPIHSITLAGSRSLAPGLTAELQAATGLPVLPPRSSITWPDGPQDFLGFEQAAGAALASAKRYRAPRHLSLRTDASRASALRKKQIVASCALALVVGSLVTVDGIERSGAVDSAEQAAQIAEGSTDIMLAQVDGMDVVRESRFDLEIAEARVADLTRQRLRYGDVLQEAAELMPQSSQLVSVQLRRSDVDGLPMGFVDGPVAGLVTFSGIASDLDTVGVWLDAVDAGRFVDGLWLDQSLHGPLGDSQNVGSFFVIEGVITDAARASDEVFG